MHKAFEQAHSLQDLMISIATGGDEDTGSFRNLREQVVSLPAVASVVPTFVRNCRSASHFWQFIRNEFGTYAERRKFIYEAFAPLLNCLEKDKSSPLDRQVFLAINRLDSDYVKEVWMKALERRIADPDGAITSARTLLESVCKHILDKAGVEYGDSPDLNKLYKMTAERLKLAPSQHTEQVFKQILGGCTSVVEGLGSVRNRLSDSHGKGKLGFRPAPRHAELAVNLAGTLATFLLETDARQ